jgi:predicted  nucleic acid-binding Zn-ribbon protein
VANYFDKKLMGFAADVAEGKISIGKLPEPPALKRVVDGVVPPNPVVGLTERAQKGHIKQTHYNDLTLGQQAQYNIGFHKQENPISNLARRFNQARKDTSGQAVGIGRLKNIVKRAKDLKYRKGFLNRNKDWAKGGIYDPKYTQAAHQFKPKPKAESYEDFLTQVIAEYRLDCAPAELDTVIEVLMQVDFDQPLSEGVAVLAEHFGQTLDERQYTVGNAPERADLTAAHFGRKAVKSDHVSRGTDTRSQDQRRADAEHAFGLSPAERVKHAVDTAKERMHNLMHKEKKPDPAALAKAKKDAEDRKKGQEKLKGYKERIARHLGSDKSPQARQDAHRWAIRGEPTSDRLRNMHTVKDHFDPAVIADEVVEAVVRYSQLIGDDTYLDTFVNEVFALKEQRAGGEDGRPVSVRIADGIKAMRRGLGNIKRGFTDPVEPRHGSPWRDHQQAVGHSENSGASAAEIAKLKAELDQITRKLDQVDREKENLKRQHEIDRGRVSQMRGAMEADSAKKAREKKITDLEAEDAKIEQELEQLSAKVDQAKRANKPAVYAPRLKELEGQISARVRRQAQIERELDDMHGA